MNTAYHLFVRRVKLNAIFQYRVIKSVVDWSVALYFVVPGFFYLVSYYYYLWNTKPDWIFNVPFLTVALFFFVLIGLSTVRSFYEYEDQLFLLQRKPWIIKLRRYGIIYSFLVHCIKTALFIICWLPVMYLGFQMDIVQITYFYLFTVLSMTLFALIKRRINAVLNTIKRLTLLFLFYVAGAASYLVIILQNQPLIIICSSVTLAFTFIIALLNKHIEYKNRFLEYVDYDILDRYKHLALLLNNTGFKYKSPRSRRPAPFLFRNSTKFFKMRSRANILSECCTKAFFRDSFSAKLYIQLTIVSCYGIYQMPPLVSYIFLFMLALTLLSLGKMVWIQFIYSDYIKIYLWPYDVKRSAMKITMILLAMPSYILVVITLLAKSQSALILLASVGAGFLSFYISLFIILRWFKSTF
ncbi:ABC transporter permease [Paenibacillus larvae]|uniref:ABC transporter permease n=1 Tax=Paenibacillus larvae TaxID=1464 RepID=UPI0023A9858D|nr:ABC transporter permease [Paenibacillus larvae]MDE5126913.1 ABC transporter permease [Paenibacillus larvae subsp. larvae]MDE5134122.1 ABC transporter permease [Paenibacillus larvae subsp. larvae]MDE5138104.1 ABC transporter permease [Paenibacillus larvae subsp. larvae]MDE5142740.1 ABC transporter permease [Paenibacillus larvae subsp. larvae]MDE5150446.1 ABC transporter permease [Paenibacillus larvae subsp. larvae]